MKTTNWAILFILLLCGSLKALASGSDIEIESLKGIKSCKVIVSAEGQKALQAGLDTATIRNDVQLKLRQAGWTVVTNDKDHVDCFLLIDLTYLPIQDTPIYAATINFQLVQPVILARTNKETFAVCWSTSMTCFIGNLKLMEGSRGFTKDCTDVLINDYLAGNPRTAK